MGNVIKITFKELLARHKRWQRFTPAYLALIINNTGLTIDRERRKNLEKNVSFRSQGTKNFMIGSKGALFWYPAKVKANSSMRSVKGILGFKKNKFRLKMWDEGGTIKKDEKNPDFTSAGRGGSWRKLPQKIAKLKTKAQSVGNGSNRIALMHKYMRESKPFYMSRTKDKQAGVYIQKNGKLIMLRGMRKTANKIPKTQWHTGAVRQVLHGRDMKKIIYKEFKKIFG